MFDWVVRIRCPFSDERKKFGLRFWIRELVFHDETRSVPTSLMCGSQTLEKVVLGRDMQIIGAMSFAQCGRLDQIDGDRDDIQKGDNWISETPYLLRRQWMP